MEHAEDREGYTSLKRSLSGIPYSHIDSVEHLTMKEPKSPKHSRRLRVDMPHPKATEVGFAALRNLPIPLLVLSSLKVILLANDAMGRLLGLHADAASGHQATMTDLLRGQTLSQIGIDMLQDGIPVWISWEKFLDNLAASLENGNRAHNSKILPTKPSADPSPSSESYHSFQLPAVLETADGQQPQQATTIVHDTVVDVAVSYCHDNGEAAKSQASHSRSRMPKSPLHTNTQMIISIWRGDEGEQYFTLTFTTTVNKTPALNASVQPPQCFTSAMQLGSPLSPNSSSLLGVSLTGTPLLTNGAPPCLRPETFTHFQKLTRMKDAMLSNMDIPVVGIWRDESAVFPNQAARKLFAVHADAASEQSYDFVSRFKAYTADFERELEEDENPMLTLCRTQKTFSNWKIGLVEPNTGKPKNFDVSGKPVVDERTGEFLVGLVAFKDVTEYTEKLASQSEENELQFQLICDTMPQMLWTTTAEGYHDYFSQRWYDYTGLTRERSLGMGWQLAFHPDDMQVTISRWAHSLATGDEYTTEYRCRRADGAWRWMLGRALPLRDVKTSKIAKWFGTCTDIQDLKSLEESNRQTHERLLEVLKHSQMSMWQVDREAHVTFFEGSTAAAHAITNTTTEEFKSQAIGRSLYEAFGSCTHDSDILQASVDRMLRGESNVDIIETKTKDNSRWFRSKLVAQREHTGPPATGDKTIVGVVGISIEVTELKRKEEENMKLLTAEAAAKEANKMKSSFLANMSHEIRTPIAGIIGMSELIIDTDLNEEQNEFAQNIQRSANTLLTVINDILDFSKIESGRLDIEEVQFSLGVVLRDVSKMLSFAAERKKLLFQSDIRLGGHGDLIVLGDPGRVRQILTNLLTNSIKFTSEGGYTKLSVHILSQTNDNVQVEFIIEDTGIGISDDVKARLFKPFSQADSSTARRFGGTGLGLSICKNLIDLMRGSIKIESKPGSGTIATFSIPFNKPQFAGTPTPLVDPGAIPDRLQSELSLSCDNSSQCGNLATRQSSPFHSPKHKPMPGPAANLGSGSSLGHILIVEDNAINQQIALRTVRNLGYSASAVWNGQEALQYLLKATESTTATVVQGAIGHYILPSLILMDVQMPVLDGYRATHTLRHHEPFKSMVQIRRIPVVAMTASAIQGDREKCERAGMNDYLAKPVKRSTLEKMVRKWMKCENQLVPGSTIEKLDDGYSAGPGLCRSGTTSTDHSSNCPGADYQVREAKAEDASHASRRTGFAHSSLNPFGTSQIEDASDSNLRRVEAEEMAASLRDAKLMFTATGDEHGLVNSTGLRGSTTHPSVTGSRMYEVYPDQHGPSLELTEENVERFNADFKDNSAATLHPPPVLLGQPLGMAAGTSVAPIESTNAIPLVTTSGGGTSTRIPTESSARACPTTSRRGRLSTSNRTQSDQSNASTMKPSDG